MDERCDILLCGTGGFAARIAFDIAATARRPVSVVIAGRNAARLDWLVLAANARAAIFGAPASFRGHRTDLLARDAAPALIGATRPKVVVQAASVQTSQVIATTGDAWSRLVAEGGLSATAVFQTVISARVAAAITASGGGTMLVNCCFPDVVNGLIAALGHKVACGMGNVAILSNAFSGARGITDPARIQVLAHYQNLAPFRRAPETRSGPAPRVWGDGQEVADVYGAFADIRLTPEPVIDISGASGVPLVLAMAAGEDWIGHVPGPDGRPGGYPVALRAGRLSLRLPQGMTEDEAVAWNRAYEERGGLVIEGGRAVYTGALRDALARHSPALAEGFAIRDIESVHAEMRALRDRLEQTR